MEEAPRSVRVMLRNGDEHTFPKGSPEGYELIEKGLIHHHCPEGFSVAYQLHFLSDCAELCRALRPKHRNLLMLFSFSSNPVFAFGTGEQI